jgi:hypothetical protein
MLKMMLTYIMKVQYALRGKIMSKEMIMFIVMIFLGSILLIVRIGAFYRRTTVGKYWLNMIETWTQICPVIPIPSQVDTEDDSDILAYLGSCVEINSSIY